MESIILDYYIAIGNNPEAPKGLLKEFSRALRGNISETDWLLCEGQKIEDIENSHPMLYVILKNSGFIKLPDSNKSPAIIEPKGTECFGHSLIRRDNQK